MDCDSFRSAQKWSLERLCEELGLGPGSKGYLSRLERGEIAWPVELALKMQLLSKGQVPARDLVSPDKRGLLDQLAPAAEAAP